MNHIKVRFHIRRMGMQGTFLSSTLWFTLWRSHSHQSVHGWIHLPHSHSDQSIFTCFSNCYCIRIRILYTTHVEPYIKAGSILLVENAYCHIDMETLY